MDLSPIEQLSLVLDTLDRAPLTYGVRVRAFGVNLFGRYDECGMPLQPFTYRGDWTTGLPDDVRAALRAIVETRYAKRSRSRHDVEIIRAWIDKQRRGSLGAEAKALRAKYLAENPAGEFRQARLA